MSHDAMMAFREKHDRRISIPKKIKEALVRLADGEKWMYSSKFQVFAGVNGNDLAEVREQFADHVVSIQDNGKARFVWCHSPEFAAELRKIPGVK